MTPVKERQRQEWAGRVSARSKGKVCCTCTFTAQWGKGVPGDAWQITWVPHVHRDKCPCPACLKVALLLLLVREAPFLISSCLNTAGQGAQDLAIVRSSMGTYWVPQQELPLLGPGLPVLQNPEMHGKHEVPWGSFGSDSK